VGVKCDGSPWSFKNIVGSNCQIFWASKSFEPPGSGNSTVRKMFENSTVIVRSRSVDKISKVFHILFLQAYQTVWIRISWIHGKGIETTGFDNLDNISWASDFCTGFDVAILFSWNVWNSLRCCRESVYDIWMLRCKQRCIHGYSRLASGACLRPPSELCRLSPIRRNPIRMCLSQGRKLKEQDSSIISGR